MKAIHFTMIALLVFLASTSVDSHAQTSQVGRGMVDICHGTRQYSVQRAGHATAETQDIVGAIALELRENETFTIRIADPNPVLFTYKAGAIERSPSANYTTFDAFANALKPLLPIEVQGAAPRQREPSPATFAQLRGNLQIDISRLYALTEDVSPVISEMATRGVDCFAPDGFAARGAVKRRVEGWRIPHLARNLADDYDRLRSQAIEIATQQSGPAGDDNDETDAVYLSVALQLQSAVMDTLTDLQAFAQDVTAIDERIEIVDEISFDARYSQSVTIEIGVVPDNAAVAAATGRSTSPIVFVVEPYTPVRLRLATGMVWTSLGHSTFSATEGSEGLEISRESGHIDRVIATMVNIVPRWATAPLSFLGQFGAAGVDGQVIFVLGGGMAIFGDRLALSGGWAFTRSDELLDQELGDRVQSAEDIRTKRIFDNSGYLSVNVSF